MQIYARMLLISKKSSNFADALEYTKKGGIIMDTIALPQCELEEAIEDVEAGRVSKAFKSTDELFSHLGI